MSRSIVLSSFIIHTGRGGDISKTKNIGVTMLEGERGLKDKVKCRKGGRNAKASKRAELRHKLFLQAQQAKLDALLA